MDERKVLFFSSHSPYGSRARIIFEGVDPSEGVVVGVRLLKRSSGNLHEYVILPGGNWSGKHFVSWEVRRLTPQVELACGRARFYYGWAFGKPGAVVELADRKGSKTYIVFGPDGPRMSPTPSEL